MTATAGTSESTSSAPLARAVISTPLGPLVAIADDRGLQRLDFVDDDLPQSHASAENNETLTQLQEELRCYFAGDRLEFTTPLAPQGTEFQQRAWKALQSITYGKTWSYSDLARAIGSRTAVRAVAQANARNPISILIPCHRVIGADGSLTGYASGLERKRWLLDLEAGVRSFTFESSATS